mgnify:FL=1
MIALIEDKKDSLLLSLDSVEEKEIEWLVPEYLPRGQICIMAGDGGSGKTTIWCSLAAAISSGTKVFFERTPEEFVEKKPQKVLFFSSEDSIEYVLKARLRKAGANLSNIFSVNLKNEKFSEIKFNSQLLRDLIEQVQPALVIFDPVQSFIPDGANMAKRNEMRSCLNHLIGIGEQYGTTSLIVVHTNKRTGAFGRKRISDSSDIWDIARSALVVGNVSGSNLRYMSQEKSNYGELAQTALFSIDDSGAHLEEYTDRRDADFVREQDFEGRQAPQRQDAEQFIKDFLRGGKKPTSELDEAAQAAGISRSSLTRAKTKLRKDNVMNVKSEGFGGNKVFYSYLLDQRS